MTRSASCVAVLAVLASCSHGWAPAGDPCSGRPDCEPDGRDAGTAALLTPPDAGPPRLIPGREPTRDSATEPAPCVDPCPTTAHLMGHLPAGGGVATAGATLGGSVGPAAPAGRIASGGAVLWSGFWLPQP